MKKVQQIIAILGVILLVGLYLTTLVLAILGKEFFTMFMSSLLASIALPVFLWLYGFLYKWLKRTAKEKQDL